MKKMLLLLIPVFLFGALFAVDFDFSGTLRERAAMYNDASENDGGHIDNRLVLEMMSQLDPRLDLALKLEIGNIIWGDSSTGGNVSTRGINVETLELYLNLKFPTIDSQVRVGQQYWADHRSLILDDQFSGIVFTMNDLMSFKSEFAFIKDTENNQNIKDDYNVFLANFSTEQPMDAGLLALVGRNQGDKKSNITLMPYAIIPLGMVNLDATVFVDYQTDTTQKDRIGFGTALKAEMDYDGIDIHYDLLVVSKDGLTTISPYYQNGFYLFGYGTHHDAVGIYWNDDYSAANNNDGFLSTSIGIKFPFAEDIKLFGNMGQVTTFKHSIGSEINGGVEYEVIKDKLTANPFAALGFPNSGADMNYLLGVNVTATF